MSFLELITHPIFGTYNATAGVLGLIFGLGAFFTYIVACLENFGVLKSISISYYSCKPRWLFQAFMFCSLFCIFLMGQNWIYALVAVFFIIMTCNPTVNGGNIFFIPHMIGAISAITLGNVGLGLTYGAVGWVICAVLVIAISATLVITSSRSKTEYPIFNWQNKLYFIEIEAISTLIIGLFLGAIVPLVC